jgi:hypothetical protein
MSENTLHTDVTTITGNILAASGDIIPNAGNITVNTSSETISVDNWRKPFWRSVFAGPDGSGSTSRITTFIIVLDTLVITSYLAYKLHAIPEKLIDLGIFATLLITTIYSPAKIAEIFSNYFAKK